MSFSIHSFVRRYSRLLKKKWYLFFYKFYRVQNNSIFFYPHPNCKADNYDIIRYHSDNVLCVVNYLLHSGEYDNYQLYVSCYKESEIKEYIQYCSTINSNLKVTFVFVDNPILIRYAAKCKLYFTDTTAPETFFKKKKGQCVIDLGYFVPFKNLYIANSKRRMATFRKNSVIDYSVTTADLPARMLSFSFNFPLENVLTLGFCRNDIFYQFNDSFKKDLTNKLNRTIKHIIVYVPTWRNYEYRGGAKNTTFSRSLFGYDDYYTDKINQILFDSEAILIAKLHPLQININVRQSIRDNILLFSDIQNKVDCSLYQLLSIADCMITDYTTTYWDFLNRDKPIIFNFYDYEKYNQTRGFSFNPIDFFCAGEIVKDGDALVNAISGVLKGNDSFKTERRKMRYLFDCHNDGKSTKRVVDFCFNK